jgi:hypothetical protein
MKRYVIYLTIIIAVIWVAPMLLSYANAATCQLTNVTWTQENAKIGDLVKYKIDGRDCPLEKVHIVVWSDHSGSADTREAEFDVYFPREGNVFISDWRVANSNPFTNASLYLVASINTSGAGSSVDSSKTGTIKYLKVAPVIDQNPTVTITDFSITPNTIPANTVTRLNVTFKVKVDSPLYFASRCSGIQAFMIDGAGNKVYTQAVRSASPTSQNYSLDFNHNYTAGGDGTVNLRGKLECAGSAIVAMPTSSPVTVTIGKGGGTGTGNTGAPGAPGTTQNYQFTVPNWLKGQPSSLTDLLDILAKWLFNLAIPVAVGLIIYAGVLLMTAGPNPANVKKGGNILKWVAIGLAIIFINKGFISLIRSILELGNK